MTRPTLIDLNPNEYNQELCYHQFMINLDRFNRSCNTPDDASSRICVPNKTEDENLRAVNIIMRINESKILTTYISCECKCKFDRRK